MKRLLLFSLLLFLSLEIWGQALRLPPSANNQRSTLIQSIGLVEIQIDYNSPDVDGREGQIWGKLVPYNEGKPFPWRAGANENTVFSFTHDVQINGQDLKAGKYGFHIIPDEKEWTLIFSKNSTSWGSFSYNEAEDALRIKAIPQSGTFTEYLTYNFTAKASDHAIVELAWENKKIEIKIDTDQREIMLASLREDLKGAAGAGPTTWKNWADAASYSLNYDLGNDEEALKWANRSIIFNPSFRGYITKYGLHDKLNQKEKATQAWNQALVLGSNEDLYRLGRGLIARGNPEKALEAFLMNKEKFGEIWPVNLGLGRGYTAVNDKKNAKKYLEKALAQAKSQRQKTLIKTLIENLSTENN